MKVEAQQLRIADVVLLPGRGSGEIVRRDLEGPDVHVWFRGDERAAEGADEDEGPPPSVVFDAAQIVEIQRPASLFDPKDRPAMVRRIVDALEPTGWVFHAGVGGKWDHLHDRHDLVRVEFRNGQVLLYLRAPAGSGTTWEEWGHTIGTFEAFEADFVGKVRELELASQQAALKARVPELVSPPVEPAPAKVERIELPKGIEERFAVLRKRLAAEGWVHHPAKAHTRVQSIVDPTDTLRIAFDGTKFAIETRLLGDYSVSRRWQPAGLPWFELRELLRKDFEAGIRRLLEEAKTEAATRDAIEARAIAREHGRKPVPEGAEPVIVRYSRDEGVLLCGPTIRYKDAIKGLHSPYSFRYSRNLPPGCAWYVPGTRGTFEPKSRIENLVGALLARGVPARVEYIEPVQTAEPPPEATIEAIVGQTGLLSAQHPERSALATAMEMAVRAGIGQDLRLWLTRTGKATTEFATQLHAAAMGRVAMEAGKWPPAPERGSRYTHAEFRGVLESIAFDPIALETLTLAEHWPRELEKVAGVDAHRRFYSGADLGHDARSSFRLRLDDILRRATKGKRKAPTDPALARTAREQVVGSMRLRGEQLRATLDPSLYDPKTDPQVVVDRLCKVSSFATQAILQGVHGFEFPNQSDIMLLCSGIVTAKAFAARTATRKAAAGVAPVAVEAPAVEPAPVEPVPVEPPSVEPVAAAARGRAPDRKRQADKLRTIAKKLAEDAEQTIGAERQENTHRRASMAANIRKRAYSDQVIARALTLAADEVERGQLTYIARLTSRPQIDDLEWALARARDERRRKTQEPYEEREPTPADVEYARFRGLVTNKSRLRELAREAEGKIDARTRKRLRPLAEGEDEVLELVGNDVDLIRTVTGKIRAAVGDQKVSYGTGALLADLRRYDRLERLGIRDTVSLRAALLEYLGCCRGKVKKATDDPIAVRKRDLQFANIPGFVPTPRPLAEQLVAAAGIRPGMRVLEPSAGSGAIAEVIRERHPDAVLDVIEHQHTLRQLLRDQGFTLVADDFTEFKPTKIRYDRIVMNPPFELRQDTQHIAHAFDLLAPAGRLVAVASGSFTSRGDNETAGLRGRIERLGGKIEKLPPGSFAASGTDVSTVLVVVDAPAAERRERPALTVVPPPAPEPAEADCGCVHAEPEPEPVKAKPKLEPPARPRWATPVMSDDDIAAIMALNAIKAKWKKFDEGRSSKEGPWPGIPNTACLQPVPGDEDLTACIPGQLKPVAIGACPPLREKPEGNTKIALCETGEPVEWFGGRHYMPEIRAEAANRLARRRSTTPIAKPSLAELPAVDDFRGQAELLAKLVPSRVVADSKRPARPIEVAVGLPHRRGVDGSMFRIGTHSDTERVRGDETLVATVMLDEPVELAEFVKGLGTRWLVYAGTLAIPTLRHLADALGGAEGDTTGVTLEHFRSGRFAGETIYWVESPKGQVLIEPINAAGRAAGLAAASEFAAARNSPLEIEVPDGWSLADTIVVVARISGQPSWLAWQPSTGLYRKKGASSPWTEPAPPPKLDDGREYDLDTEAARALLHALDDAPRGTRFRAAGSWLGHLYPSDFGKRVDFEPPTGGELDVGALRADYARLLAQLEGDPDKLNETATEQAKKRIAWASKWIAAQDKAAKPKVAKKPKAPEAVKTPEPAAAPPVPLAVVPDAGDVEHEREQEQPMKTTSTEKKVGKKTGGKKSSAKKAAAAKKKASKQAAAAEPPRTTKKASKKAPVAEPRTTKKVSKKAPAVAPPKPVEKIAAAPTKLASAKGGACASDDTCPPELETWRARLRRGDRVRFRKNSRIAAALGIDTDRVFEIRCTTCRSGQRFAILNLGIGSASDVAIPVGQFAVVERRPEMPRDIRVCVSKLAKMGGPISAATREIVARFAQES
jgi:phospholipid N-methyltransferase